MTFKDELALIGERADQAIGELGRELAVTRAEAETAKVVASQAQAEAAQRATELAAAQAQVRSLVAQIAAYEPVVPAGWAVLWQDLFNGTAVDTTKWNVRSDTQNNHYGANLPSNAVVKDGTLTEWLRREAVPIKTRSYSTAYLDTIGKSAFRYGCWEIRCKLTKAKGSWPAFWLRDGALKGEIDALEFVSDGKGGGKLVFTVHESTDGDKAKRGFEWKIPVGFDFNAWHTFAVDWDGTTMAFLVDGVVVTSITVTQYPWLATAFGPAGLNIRLNHQAGGSMPKWYGLDLDATSVLPDPFVIDYVRYMKRA